MGRKLSKEDLILLDRMIDEWPPCRAWCEAIAAAGEWPERDPPLNDADRDLAESLARLGSFPRIKIGEQ